MAVVKVAESLAMQIDTFTAKRETFDILAPLNIHFPLNEIKIHFMW